VNGYLHPRYADSLSEFGTPRELPRCQGWILERLIPGTPDRDAMGYYPLFARQDWSKLHLDLNEMETGELVSLSLVADPFRAFSTAAFASQLEIPGLVALRARSAGVTIGMHLWYVHREVAYSHLAAFSPVGYDLMASYALYWSAI
jgi:hypothetical protein